MEKSSFTEVANRILVEETKSYIKTTGHEYQFRLLQKEDFDRGFLSCMEGLTLVGEITREEFGESFAARASSGTLTVVAADTETDQIIATGSLILERKFVRNCGLVGHIEDIATCEDYRGKKLGETVVRCLKSIADASGCYKTILDCRDELIPFYGKNGFKKKETQCVAYNQEVVEANEKLNASRRAD